ncbi:dihydrolipoyl dehydrogenase [Paenalcaligenes sp. Me131]|uniref:dihydrolipoyl dehydrogenase n=1 Tax=Paenalcaligenes sp. Me131 TaxID=3392636 RepID=UPI003D26F9F0
MTLQKSTTLLIVGGGPGGYVAALRAAQQGIATVLVEGGGVGGTCLNVGCIPSKALIHASSEFHLATRYAQTASPLGISVATPNIDLAKTVAWKDAMVSKLTSGVNGLLRKAGVQLIQGWARILDGKTVEIEHTEGIMRMQCEHLMLATGSQAVALPHLPFGGDVLSSTQALSLTQVPKRFAVIGAGYIGLELGMAYARLGSAVTIVEASDRVLPGYDAELVKPVEASLKALGVQLQLSCSVKGFEAKTTTLSWEGADGVAGSGQFDKVLVAVGRHPFTKGFGLESLQLAMNGNAIRVDDQCRTSMHQVWAIGDVTGEPMLAHRAMAQAEVAVDVIAGKKRHFMPASIPAVCFTDPEIVTAGVTPEQAAASGMDCITGIFHLAANGRAMTMEASAGFVRVVARRDNHAIVGWQAVGEGVAELVSTFGLSLEMQSRLEDIAGTIHAHPSLGEALQEAAFHALGRGLHR